MMQNYMNPHHLVNKENEQPGFQQQQQQHAANMMI